MPVYNSKEEAVQAFLSLLDAKKISSRMHFKEVARKVSYDVRWDAIRNFGERKQVYAEYVSVVWPHAPVYTPSWLAGRLVNDWMVVVVFDN